MLADDSYDNTYVDVLVSMCDNKRLKKRRKKKKKKKRMEKRRRRKKRMRKKKRKMKIWKKIYLEGKILSMMSKKIKKIMVMDMQEMYLLRLIEKVVYSII